MVSVQNTLNVVLVGLTEYRRTNTQSSFGRSAIDRGMTLSVVRYVFRLFAAHPFPSIAIRFLLSTH